MENLKNILSFSPIISRRYKSLIAVLLAALWVTPCYAQQLAVTPQKATGIYNVGEVIRWQVNLKGNTSITEVNYSIKKGGLKELTQGTLKLVDGAGVIEAKLDEPGTVLAEVNFKLPDGKVEKAFGGAAVEPEKIKPSSTRPDDFDEFWKSKLKELKSVPVNAKLEPGQSDKPNVDYYKISMDNIRGTHIQGQLARPSQGKKFPALLIVQWAGVYGLQKSWVMDRAAEGWLVLNINAHDLPIDQPESFYKDQFGGPLKDYWAIGNESRDTSYFLRMYLSCYRAAEYLTKRSDWNGKTLVVQGGSQGGQQALVTAALHPKITAALANVPAGSDMLGPDMGRAPGWPMWYWRTAGKDADQVRKASRYYDVVNFMPRVKCPVLVSAGLIDDVCPPSGIFAALNQTRGPKEVVVLVRGDHYGANDSHADYNKRCWGDWLPALRQGKAAPVKEE
jgi:cephalosporin-C deacetylase-like acetyl esterase